MRGKIPQSLISTVILALALYGQGPSPVGAATWVNVTGNLANMASECGNLTLLSPVPGSGSVIAGVAQKGLWINSTGTTWTHLGGGAGSDVITNRPSWISYDPLNPSIFWESGSYNGGGVFKTTDGGNTFQRLGTISHNDYVSEDFTDPARQTLLAGGHEQSQTIYKSTNGGGVWTNVGMNMPAGTKFTSHPVVIDSQTYVVDVQGWGTGTAGIFRTTNGGTTWTPVSSTGPNGPPLITANGTIYWNAGGSLLRSTNQGQTWTSVGSGLQPVTPVQLPDGRLATLGGNNSIVISSNDGGTWTPITPALPFNNAAGLIYSQQRQAFFIWKWDCGSVVLPDAIQKLDFAVGGATVPAAPTNLRIVRN